MNCTFAHLPSSYLYGIETEDNATVGINATTEGIGMSSRKEHEKAGINAAWKAYLDYVQIQNLPQSILRDMVALYAASKIGRYFGTLADKLEPATSPYHRSILHSQDVNRFLDNLRVSIRLREESDIVSDVLIDMAAAAYQSHI